VGGQEIDSKQQISLTAAGSHEQQRICDVSGKWQLCTRPVDYYLFLKDFLICLRISGITQKVTD